MKDHETRKDGAQGQPPLKAKTGGEQERQHRHADGHPAARPDVLGDERLSHPANAEPLAELLSQLQHSHGNAYVQRVVGEAGGEKKEEPKPSAGSRARGDAQGLDAGTRSLMESAFGESFGDVRVHTGKEAAAASEQLGARAFTRGRDIYFKEGEYDPSTREGKKLLAHELTHVVQQRGGSSAQESSVGRAGDAHEREADDVAGSVVRGERVRVERQSAAPAYQRQTPGQRTEQRPVVHSQPVHLYLDQHSGGTGFPPAGMVNFQFDTGSSTEHILVLRLPPGMTFRIRPLRGSTYRAEPAGETAAPGERVVTVHVPRAQRQPVIRMRFRHRNVTFYIHFHFYRQAQTP